MKNLALAISLIVTLTSCNSQTTANPAITAPGEPAATIANTPIGTTAPQENPAIPSYSAISQSPAPITQSPMAQVSATPTALDRLKPLHVVFAADRTGSKTRNKIPDISLTQLRTLANGIRSRSGDLRFTTICSDSDKAMPRLKFNPTDQPPTAPTTINTAGMNAFDKANLQDREKIQQATYQQQKAEFDRKQQAQAIADQVQIETFLKTIQPLVEQPANCLASDMEGIMRRALLALQERQPAGTPEPRRVIFLITDGEHNATSTTQLPALNPQTELVTVNSGKGAGIFETLNPTKFDSIDGAIADLLSR
jgi:hypothetical protein